VRKTERQENLNINAAYEIQFLNPGHSLPELKDDWNDEKKMKTIEKAYQELSAPKHPVAIAIEQQKLVKEVRIIEGLEK
jgi:hypothetical protein